MHILQCALETCSRSLISRNRTAGAASCSACTHQTFEQPHFRAREQAPSLTAGLCADIAVRVQRECCFQVRYSALSQHAGVSRSTSSKVHDVSNGMVQFRAVRKRT